MDELTREVERLRGELERQTKDYTHHRVLIAATRDGAIEVFADPQIRLSVICIPETRSNEDHDRACEWALSKAPHEFRSMMYEASIRPELFTLYCPSYAEFKLYLIRMAEYEYLQRLGEGIDEVVASVKQQENTDHPF